MPTAADLADDPEHPSRLKPPPEVAVTPCDPWPRPYYLEEGLRRVRPYHFTYNTYCKERWRGREIIDVFASEFRDRPLEYYRAAMHSGKITINGSPVASPQTIIRNGDIISHTLHRHEPPVTASPIGIIHESEDFIVINKPAGMPVHPAGRYNYNSLIEILRAQRGFQFNPLPCNRLDRLTSGIMFIGKHKKAAEGMTRQLTGRTVRKEYVARVVGRFPDGDVVCEQPMLQISPKLGLNQVRANGKEARTVFRRLAWYPGKEDGSVSTKRGTEGEEAIENGMADSAAAHNDTSANGDIGPAADADSAATTDKALSWRNKTGYSIVRCLPLTGRTHQLRVHLQFLGHPITNDPIYCNQKVFGANLGYAASSASDDEDIISRLSRMGKEEVADAVAYHDEMVEEYEKRKAEKMTGEVCEVCQTPLYSDPGIHELGIYLHARRYADLDGRWEYETELPAWALPPEGVQGPLEATRESDPFAVVDEGRIGEEPGRAAESHPEGVGGRDPVSVDGNGQNGTDPPSPR